MLFTLETGHTLATAERGWTLTHTSGPIEVTREYWNTSVPQTGVTLSETRKARGKPYTVYLHRSAGQAPSLTYSGLTAAANGMIRHGIITNAQAQTAPGRRSFVNRATALVHTIRTNHPDGTGFVVRFGGGRFELKFDAGNYVLSNPARDVTRTSGDVVGYTPTVRLALKLALDRHLAAVEESHPYAALNEVVTDAARELFKDLSATFAGGCNCRGTCRGHGYRPFSLSELVPLTSDAE